MSEGSECNVDLLADYDLGLHIGSIFILMGCSFLGTMLPIITKKSNVIKESGLLWNCGKMFGSVVILATALVHMLTPAGEQLSNPCLPAVFEEGYGAFPTAICLFAILFLHFIQFIAMKQIHHKHHHTSVSKNVSLSTINVEEGSNSTNSITAVVESNHDEHHGHTHGHELLLQNEKKVSTILLELGIVSHSIIIGVTLGIARSPDFVPLLIALVFHQFFEGIALSTVVMDTKFEKKIASLFMVLFYSITTPIGIAIGIGVYKSFNENSVSALVTTGVLDAFSAGFLLYDGLVNIVAAHFRSEKFIKTRDSHQFLQLAALWLGSFAMALVGKWA